MREGEREIERRQASASLFFLTASKEMERGTRALESQFAYRVAGMQCTRVVPGSRDQPSLTYLPASTHMGGERSSSCVSSPPPDLVSACCVSLLRNLMRSESLRGSRFFFDRTLPSSDGGRSSLEEDTISREGGRNHALSPARD